MKKGPVILEQSDIERIQNFVQRFFKKKYLNVYMEKEVLSYHLKNLRIVLFYISTIQSNQLGTFLKGSIILSVSFHSNVRFLLQFTAGLY